MYDETVYLLDLCILSYHLHAQTLIWPFDPYYEQMIVKAIGGEEVTGKASRERRNKFMEEVRAATDLSANLQEDLHGPGSCQGDSQAGWAPNQLLEPIIANYAQIYPWRPAFTRPTREDEPWIVYNSPSVITDRIKEVHMVQYYRSAGPNHNKPKVRADPIHTQRPVQNRQNIPAATDLLYCFEGGTGAIRSDKTEGDKSERKYAAWSMMGFVLARTITNAELNITANPGAAAGYNVYIVFRGSRSGKLRPKEAGFKEKGNPDWVTDFDLNQVVSDEELSAQGSVCRGFGTSIKSMLLPVEKAMTEIHAAKAQKPPRSIYVTGHSLGAALACHFTSAMVCGTKYGPSGAGKDMPDSLKLWPWSSVQLVTFSSPVVGGAAFKKYFDNKIGSRRVWLDGDPITQERINYLVGVPCRITRRDTTLKRVVLLPSSHEPYLIRRNLILWRLSDNIDMSDVPAPTGKPHKDEPWKLFKYCNDMMSDLERMCRDGGKSWPFRDLFPNLAEHLLLYLEILQNSLPNLLPAKATKLQTLINDVKKIQTDGKPPSLSSLENSWTSAVDITGDDNFGDFIGLCLFLAGLCKGLGDFPNSASGITQGKYPSLLKERI
jgi:hypothetical protein